MSDLKRVPSAMKPLVTIMASLTEYPSSQTCTVKYITVQCTVQQPDHGQEGHDVEDGAVVGKQRHQLVGPAVHHQGGVVYRSPGVPDGV